VPPSSNACHSLLVRHTNVSLQLLSTILWYEYVCICISISISICICICICICIICICIYIAFASAWQLTSCHRWIISLDNFANVIISIFLFCIWLSSTCCSQIGVFTHSLSTTFFGRLNKIYFSTVPLLVWILSVDYKGIGFETMNWNSVFV
jgi:hypothetical protein